MYMTTYLDFCCTNPDYPTSYPWADPPATPRLPLGNPPGYLRPSYPPLASVIHPGLVSPLVWKVRILAYPVSIDHIFLHNCQISLILCIITLEFLLTQLCCYWVSCFQWRFLKSRYIWSKKANISMKYALVVLLIKSCLTTYSTNLQFLQKISEIAFFAISIFARSNKIIKYYWKTHFFIILMWLLDH